MSWLLITITGIDEMDSSSFASSMLIFGAENRGPVFSADFWTVCLELKPGTHYPYTGLPGAESAKSAPLYMGVAISEIAVTRLGGTVMLAPACVPSRPFAMASAPDSMRLDLEQ